MNIQEIAKIQASILYFRLIGSWFMADQLEKILNQYLEEIKNVYVR